MLLANFNGKEHLRHRAVSLRQHGFLVVYAKITLSLTHSALASILVGVSKHYAHALIGNVGDGNCRPSFYKKQYLSNGQTGCRDIFHTDIANR